MAYPTGSGSEQLRRGACVALSNVAPTALTFDGTHPTVGTNTATVPALHIITILNIIFTETAGNAEEIYLQYNAASAPTWTNIVREQPIPPLGTFVFSDKLVLIGGDQISISTKGTADVDVHYCYIDQNWDNS